MRVIIRVEVNFVKSPGATEWILTPRKALRFQNSTYDSLLKKFSLIALRYYMRDLELLNFKCLDN